MNYDQTGNFGLKKDKRIKKLEFVASFKFL